MNTSQFQCPVAASRQSAAHFLYSGGKCGARPRRRYVGLLFALAALLLTAAWPARAQWLTQTNVLKSGWNAVYLHVDVSHTTITSLIVGDTNNPILEVWLWAPTEGPMQYVQSQDDLLASGAPWKSWVRTASESSALQRLTGNAAYLVRVNTNVSTYTWIVQGKPVPPVYQWFSSGLNFLGFPTVSVNPPKFAAFLAQATNLPLTSDIYQYVGGVLGSANPAKVLDLQSTLVKRGQAFWIRSGTAYNTFFAPFDVSFPTLNGVRFDTNLGIVSFPLRNLTTSNLTVTLCLVPSETPPFGQTPIAGTPPLLVRGALNTTNLTYAYSVLNAGGSVNWVLKPQGQSGSVLTVVMGVNRYALTNVPGALFAGVLRFTDSLGFAQVDVPVSAQADSTAGLWVGGARVNQVANYLKSYQLGPQFVTNGLVVTTNFVPVTDSNGAYVVTGTNTDLGAVLTVYPLRLIVHNDGANCVLLQRVYYGLRQDTNLVVATTESALDTAHLDAARRITATHLPWTATNTVWPLGGQLAPGGTLSTMLPIVTDYADQAANPFLHTYHPDHDNLDASFKTQLAQGAESYQISRQITLSIVPPGDDFTSLTTANRVLSGNYQETITLGGVAGATRTFNVAGSFTLTRLTPPVSILTRQ